VAGFHLTLEAPSVTSVALAVRHLVLPKGPPAHLEGPMPDWPTAGLPDVIHVDNAKEFRSSALRRGAQEYGMDLLFRPVATPRYGGHIERLIGTMMGRAHLLPGTTFSGIAERGDYDSVTTAAMTLDELEAWLVLEIARYHADKHEGMGLPPRTAWEEALAQRPSKLRHPMNPASFVLDFLPSASRMLRRDGLHLFGIRYWDDALSVWVGRLKRPLRVVYDPRDLSTVTVKDPEGAVHAIRFADLRRPPITLAEHRAAQAELRARGAAEVDEELIFATILRQRALVDTAVTATRMARRQTERRERALAAVASSQQPETPPEIDERVPIDLPYYEVEEWDDPPIRR
jgi:putative transposase